MQNYNTICRGPCTRVFVKKTNNEEECMNICKERELCRHYIWHYKDAPTTHHDEECFVVDVEPGADDWAYRSKYINAATGSCNTGSMAGYSVLHLGDPPSPMLSKNHPQNKGQILNELILKK